MNLYDVTVILIVEADNTDDVLDLISDILQTPLIMSENQVKDYDIKTVRKLPLVRRDDL